MTENKGFNAYGLIDRFNHKLMQDRRKAPMSSNPAHTALVKKPRAKSAKEEIKATLKVKSRDETFNNKMSRAQQQAAHLNRRMDKIEKHPSKLGIALLNEIASSRKNTGAERTRASDILLRWGTGDFSHGRRKRPSPA